MLIVTVNKVFDHTPTDSWRVSIKLPLRASVSWCSLNVWPAGVSAGLKTQQHHHVQPPATTVGRGGEKSRLRSNKASGLADLSRDAWWETSLSSYRCHIQKKQTKVRPGAKFWMTGVGNYINLSCSLNSLMKKGNFICPTISTRSYFNYNKVFLRGGVATNVS